MEALTAAERAELRQAFADLRAQVAASAPPEAQQAAISRVDGLEDTVTGEQPDPTTIELVRRSFVRNLPSLAGAVTSLIINPLVGRAVAAAGEALLPIEKER